MRMYKHLAWLSAVVGLLPLARHKLCSPVRICNKQRAPMPTHILATYIVKEVGIERSEHRWYKSQSSSVIQKRRAIHEASSDALNKPLQSITDDAKRPQDG